MVGGGGRRGRRGRRRGGGSAGGGGGGGGSGSGSGSGSGNASRYALADEVYELSSKLGALRRRSVANVTALRSAAQVRSIVLLQTTQRNCLRPFWASGAAMGVAST